MEKEPWEMTADEWRKANKLQGEDMSYQDAIDIYTAKGNPQSKIASEQIIKRADCWRSDDIEYGIKQGKTIPADVALEYSMWRLEQHQEALDQRKKQDIDDNQREEI